MTDKADLRECPFCGSTDIYFHDVRICYCCNQCDAEGGWSKDKADALINWNTRATPVALASGETPSAERKDHSAYQTGHNAALTQNEVGDERPEFLDDARQSKLIADLNGESHLEVIK